MSQRDSDAAPARRAWSPVVIALAAIAAIAVIGVIVFAVVGLGIRPVRQPMVAPTSSAPALPTPASPVIDGVPVATAAPKPAQLFDADCSQLYTEDELSQVTGETMALSEGGTVTAENGGQLLFALEQSGGLSCSWIATRDDGLFSSESTQVSFFALPITAAPLTKELSCGPAFSESMGQYVCGIEHLANGVRFSGGVSTSSRKTTDALAARVITHLDERAAAIDPSAPSPVDGAWTNPVNCEALAHSIDVTKLFGPDGTFGEDGLGHGAFGPPVGREITSGYETLTCTGYVRDGDRITASYAFGIMGGGAWLRDELGQSTPTVVPGIGEVFTRDHAYYVYTGPNLITLTYTDGNDYGDIADTATPLREIVAALDASAR